MVNGTDRRPALPNVAVLAGFVGLAYYAIFLLPFYYPPSRRLVSPSYVFGFNNAVAILAIGVLLLVATGLLWFWLISGHRKETANQVAALISGGRPSSRMPRTIFVAAALCYLGVTMLLYFLAKTTSSYGIEWESAHFLYRLRLMEFYGLRPYLDFQFEYGPVLSYLPYWFHKLLAPLDVSLEASYYASYYVLNLLGLLCLFVVLDGGRIPLRRKIVAFVLLAIASFGLWMGLNGVSSRYLLPYLGVILIHRAAIREQIPLWALFALTFLLALANIVMSSEIGLAFTIACVAYALLAVRRRASIGLVVLMGLALAVGVAATFIPTAYIVSVFRFSSGANNYPVLPAPHVVLYLLTLFLVVPVLLGAALLAPPADGPLLLALAALCVVMIPGAASRCDPPHVLLYGLGVSMLLFILLAGRPTRAFLAYAAAYAVIAIALLQSNNLRQFYSIPYKEQASLRFLSVLSAEYHKTATPTSKVSAVDYSALEKYTKMGVPFASYETDRAMEAYLFSHEKIAPEYFVATVGVYTEDDYARKCREEFRNDYLLVRSGTETRWQPPDKSSEVSRLRAALMYPAHLTMKNEPFDPNQEINHILARHYTVAERVGDYAVLRRIDTKEPTSAICRPAEATSVSP